MSHPTGEAVRLLGYFQDRKAELLETLDHLVRLESPTGNVDALTRLVGEYRFLLEGAGMECREIPGPAGPMLHGSIPAEEKGPAPVVLVGHADTVWPLGEVSRRPPVTRDGRYYAPGAFDMKAGLTLVLHALCCLRDRKSILRRPVELFLSVDEEVGSTTAHPHMDALFEPEAIALVLEPPMEDGSLKLWRKGVGMYSLEVRGREAHAGNEPHKGVHAILELCRRVIEIMSWTDRERGIFVNVGEVRGGVATNVVPGSASAGIDTRFDSLADGRELDRKLRALQPEEPGAELSLGGDIIFPPLVPDGRSRALADRAVEVAAALGLGLSRGRSGGGSDGSFLAARGLAVLDGLGVDGGGAHAEDEHIVLEALPRRAALLTGLLEAFAGSP